VDQERVAELYRNHVPAMRRLAYLMLDGDRDRAEDLVHDAFIKTVAKLPTMRDTDRFEAYLRQSVANAVISWGRRRGVERRWLQRQTVGHQSWSHDAAAEEIGGAEHVVALLSLLPPRQRLAVTARICLDLSDAQTAALLGCSTGTVKSLTSRGLATLRTHTAIGSGLQSTQIGELS
jgi:RNA polymerase sigma factor (sigma-70 family)